MIVIGLLIMVIWVSRRRRSDPTGSGTADAAPEGGQGGLVSRSVTRGGMPAPLAAVAGAAVPAAASAHAILESTSPQRGAVLHTSLTR